MRYQLRYRIFLYMKDKKYTEFLIRLKRYCKYQERCKSDLEKKLTQLKVPKKIKESIICELSKNRYFDDNRFSEEYAIGKLRNNNWGKIKIRYNLKCKSIKKDIIDSALEKIPENEYSSTFYKIAKNEWLKRSKLDLNSRKTKFYKNLQSRGWEFNLITKFLLEKKML